MKLKLAILLSLTLMLWNSPSIAVSVFKPGEDVAFYKAPSPDFQSMELQTHKGLLRFGRMNTYIFDANGNEKDHSIYKAEKGRDKQDKSFASMKMFEKLLVFKHLLSYHQNMDKERIVERNSTMNTKEKNSYIAQNNLLKVASLTAGPRIIREYFCNEEAEDCNRLVTSNKFGGTYIYYWGGQDYNEFSKLRSFKGYVSSYFEDLKKWSKSLFKNDQQEAYYVQAIKLGTYDFEAQGYWLDRRKSIGTNSFLNHMDFEPSKIENRKIANWRKPYILFKIAPDRAEKFRNEHNTVYIVHHVNVKITGLSHGKDAVEKKFDMASDTLTLYADEALTQQVALMPIASIITK